MVDVYMILMRQFRKSWKFGELQNYFRDWIIISMQDEREYVIKERPVFDLNKVVQNLQIVEISKIHKKVIAVNIEWITVKLKCNNSVKPKQECSGQLRKQATSLWNKTTKSEAKKQT